MSSIPTKQIDGDVAIGRDANVGGNATVRGSLKVGHNLTVEGWLDAKNIKGPNKGLFKTAAQLREAYPNPHEGWWALVTIDGSVASDHLGQLYVADGGAWVAQVDSKGNPLLRGNPVVDSTKYIDALRVDVNKNKEDIRSLGSTQGTQGNSINTLNTQMGTAQSDISTLKKTVSDNKTELAGSISGVQKDLTSFKNTKGQPNGLAPLDEHNQVPSQYLPDYVDDVLEFGGMVSGVTVQSNSLENSSTDKDCSVVYNKSTECFVIACTTITDAAWGLKRVTYYNNWIDGDLYGKGTLKGRVPRSGKVYIDVSTNKTYRWGNGTLVAIGGSTAQNGVQGTSENYVYSSASDETRTVLSGKMWTYTHTDGNLFLRFKKWGANNDTAQQDYCQVMLMGCVSNDKWGLMNPYVYARLNNHTLAEGQSTLDAVKVNYTRFDDSGNNVLTLTKATSAKAGVMTASDKTLLSGLGKHLHPDPDNLTTLEALNTALDAMGPDTAQGTHHLSCWGIPLAVTLAVLNVGDKVLMQTITGSITTNTAATALATINATGHYTTLVRYYQEGKWGIWASIGDSISASINVSQLDTYFMKEDDKGGVVVDMVKCKNAKPIYVVVDDEGNRVGLLFTHSDTMKHCLVLNFLTHITLGDDGSLITSEHKHTYDYPKFYRKNLGFKFFSNAGESDPSYFEKLQASKWYCPLDEQFKRMVPTLQGGAAGDGKKYIYSQGGSDNTRTVLSSKMWIRQNGAYDQFLCFKHWGATNDTSESQCSQVMLPKAWIGGTGLLRWDIYRRLDAFELREQNSTATEVKIVTPIFTTGGTRELSISQATTAKAGVMTAADKSKLDRLSDISAEGARAAKALYKATGGTKLFGPNNIFDTNNRTLGGVVNKTLYDSSTPTEYTKGSPFEVFCTQGIKSDVDSKKYMIWFGLRKSATYIERYSCQQVIGQTEAEFYVYGTPVAFRLNNGEVYTPQQGSGGLEIGTSTKYIVSRECVIPSYSDLHDAATSEKDGLMSAADKAQLDVIAASMDSFGNSITEQAKRIYDLEQCKPLATKSRNGFMSSEDKTQLQGAFADFNARRQANDVEGYVGKSNVISVPGDVRNTQIAADIYRNAEERDYTPGASFGVYISAGYDENNPNKQCVWFGLPIEATKFVRYRLDYWLHGTADTLVGKYLCDSNDKYYVVREGAVGEYISEASDDTPCIMTIADKRILNQIKQKLGL